MANASKRIFVIAVSIMLLRNPVSLSNAAGMSIAVLGVFFYNKAKFDQRARKQVATVLPFQVKEASLLPLTTSIDVDDRAPVIVVPTEPRDNGFSPAFTKPLKSWQMLGADDGRTWA